MWQGDDDAERPLEARGLAQAERLVPVLGGVRHQRGAQLDALRCRDTVRAVRRAAACSLVDEPPLSEEGHRRSRDAARRRAARARSRSRTPLVLCSHRPVLPDLLAEALDEPRRRAPATGAPLPLAPARSVVLHRDRRAAGSAVERHRAPTGLSTSPDASPRSPPGRLRPCDRSPTRRGPSFTLRSPRDRASGHLRCPTVADGRRRTRRQVAPQRGTYPVTITRYGRGAVGRARAGRHAWPRACGSDNNTPRAALRRRQRRALGISCATGSIKASGSTAQKNAMTDVDQRLPDRPAAARRSTTRPTGSGAGVQDFINNQTSFAGSDSALKPDETTPRPTPAARPATAINIPMVGGADRRGVQRRPASTSLIADPGGARRDLRQHDHQVERPDDRRAQHRRDPAGRDHRAVPPLRRVGHHRQLHQVPHGAGGPDLWTYEGGKAWTAPGGQGAKGSDGVAAALKTHAELASATSSSRSPRRASLGVAQVDNGGGAVELDAGRTRPRPSTPPAGRAPATTCALKIDYTIKTRAPTRSCWSPTRSPARRGCRPTSSTLTKSFLTYTASATRPGQAQRDSGYVPLTGDLLTKVQASVAAISLSTRPDAT